MKAEEFSFPEPFEVVALPIGRLARSLRKARDMKIRSISRTFAPVSKRMYSLLLTALPLAGPATAQQPAANQPPQYIERSYPVPAGNDWPDKNTQMQMHRKSATKKSLEAANVERKRQIDHDSTEILKLASELNTSAQSSDQGALSNDIIRRAELIERLARAVKEKMKLTVNGS